MADIDVTFERKDALVHVETNLEVFTLTLGQAADLHIKLGQLLQDLDVCNEWGIIPEGLPWEQPATLKGAVNESLDEAGLEEEPRFSIGAGGDF